MPESAAGGVANPTAVAAEESVAVRALVRLAVETVTSTVPLPGGAVVVICVELSTLKLAAGVLPNPTSVAPEKSVPVIVTIVPPGAGPWSGSIPVTIGDGGAGLTIAIPCATALGPPSLSTRTVVLKVPGREYVWVPLTRKLPLGCMLIVA